MKKPIILGFYGTSNTGKTAVLTNLIKWLNKNQYKVSSVKITDKPINIDEPGKDTFKHSLAGSNCVVFSTSIQTSFIYSENMDEKNIIENLKLLDTFDIILIEGSNDRETSKIRMDGECNERENTLFTYDGDIDRIKNYIKKKFFNN